MRYTYLFCLIVYSGDINASLFLFLNSSSLPIKVLTFLNFWVKSGKGLKKKKKGKDPSWKMSKYSVWQVWSFFQSDVTCTVAVKTSHIVLIWVLARTARQLQSLPLGADLSNSLISSWHARLWLQVSWWHELLQSFQCKISIFIVSGLLCHSLPYGFCPFTQ